MRPATGQRVVVVSLGDHGAGTVTGYLEHRPPDVDAFLVRMDPWHPEPAPRHSVHTTIDRRVRALLLEQCIPASWAATADACPHDRPRLLCLDGRCWAVRR